jgi:hypothetical protein
MLVRSVALALVFGSSLPLGQQAVPPPPKPVDAQPQAVNTGPSLADTMKYIEDKLNNNPPVSYTAYPTDGSPSFEMDGSNLKKHYTADASACSLIAEGQSEILTVRTVVPLRSASKIDSSLHYRYEPDPSQLLVMMRTASVKVTSTHPDFDFKVDKKHPVAPMVTETTPLRKGWLVEFDDADAADRTAKALMHAVELCGGAQKKELF